LEEVAKQRRASNTEPPVDREHNLVARVQRARKRLKASGKDVTCRSIADSLWLSVDELMSYPRVKTILDRVVLERQREKKVQARARDDQLAVAVEDAIGILQDRRETVSRKQISILVGRSLDNLENYPRTASILKKLSEERRQEHGAKRLLDEADLIARFEQAATQLERSGQLVTGATISRVMGLHQKAIWKHPQLRELLRQRRTDNESVRRANAVKREAELLVRVQQAIEELKVVRSDITQAAIAAKVGMSVMGLKFYPKVKVIVERYTATPTRKPR
jgi:hypothetical protein